MAKARARSLAQKAPPNRRAEAPIAAVLANLRHILANPNAGKSFSLWYASIKFSA
jgi:hypothetical protein